MAAASIKTAFLSHCKPIQDFSTFVRTSQTPQFFTKTKQVAGAVRAVTKDQGLIPVKSNDFNDHQIGVSVSGIEREVDEGKEVQLIGGFGDNGNDGRLFFEGGFSSASANSSGSGGSGGGDGNKVVDDEAFDKLIDRAINASIVLAAGTYAIIELLTTDHDSWHGWTIYEILRYAPQHNWSAYEEALTEKPVLAKMMTSGQSNRL